MNRRLALTLAGTGAIVVAAASSAVAANLGLLTVASPDADPVGNLDGTTVADLVSSAPTAPGDPVVVYVDEYVTVPAGGVARTPGAVTGESGTTTGAVAAGDDHGGYDDEVEYDDDDEVEHEDVEHEDEVDDDDD